MTKQKIANVRFKSNPEVYEKEKSGLKPNTVRRRDRWLDKRFKILDSFAMGKRKDLTIDIEDRITGESFHRLVKDVTIYGDLYIISWGTS